MLEDNLKRIRERIGNAAVKAGRSPEEVTLLAVTKRVDAETAGRLLKLGVNELGENRVQSLLEKYEVLGSAPTWHLIGHLQTNKVKYIADKVELIHSVDSVRLAEEISRQAQKTGKLMNILLEVNVSGEESKFGVTPGGTEETLLKIAELPGVSVRGLMTIAPKTENPDENRKYFCRLREIFVDIRSKKYDNINMEHLSMGMSGDFEAAVLEGATIVRIGSALFEPYGSIPGGAAANIVQ